MTLSDIYNIVSDEFNKDLQYSMTRDNIEAIMIMKKADQYDIRMAKEILDVMWQSWGRS